MITCSKIGGTCQHPVVTNPKFIFVIMPFKGFDSVYDVIKQSITQIKKPKFVIERADEKYTNLSIWCSRICKNIRKASYCVVDTTGRNANVFYELGFTHALSSAKTIIITQNIKDAPFDIREIGHIVYSIKDLPKLRIDLINALNDLKPIGANKGKKGAFQTEDISEINMAKLAEELRPHLQKELLKDNFISELYFKINQKY